jgi:hypothetical protein
MIIRGGSLALQLIGDKTLFFKYRQMETAHGEVGDSLQLRALREQE